VRRDNVGSLGGDQLGQEGFDPREHQSHVVPGRSGGKIAVFRQSSN